MGSKERIQRLKDEVHKSIIDAAMNILKNEGRESISIRKIADSIEYSAPVIYSYFLNKEAILIELSRRGIAILIKSLEKGLVGLTEPKARMEAILTNWLDFAIKENELYQLTYTVGTNVADVEETFPALSKLTSLFRKEIIGLRKGNPLSEETCRCNFLTFISLAHGLAAMNCYYKDIDAGTNCLVLKKMVHGIMNSIEIQ